MNEKEKAIFKLEEAKQRCNWVITQTKSGVIPNGRNIEDLQEAKDIMETVQTRIDLGGTEPGIIIDNPKPHWMPKMICTIADLPFNVGRDYSWEEIEAVIIELCLAGCDGVRIFGNGWEPYIEAFKKTTAGKYSFFKRNLEWDQTLRQFGDLLHKYYMSLEVEAYDNCSHALDWNPFKNSAHNFSHCFYGYTNRIKTNRMELDAEDELRVAELNEVDFMIEYWDDRIIDCLDFIKGDKYRLGNELKSHVENNVSEIKVWAENWGVTRAKHAFDRGMPWPISFSGSEKTAHKLHGFISAEEHGKDAKPHDSFSCKDYGWTYRTAALEVHGLGTPGHVDAWAIDGISQRRIFADDDDGVGTNPDSKVPPSQRGYCEIRKDGSEYACTADTPTRIAAARAFIAALGNRTFCYSLGFLPRSILYKGKTVLSNFDKEVDAAIYWELARDLWGVDIQRKWSTE